MVGTDKWTIVQHSGFGYAHNPQFERAVETRSVASKAEIELVRKVGGLLFNSYKFAEDFAEKANYPADNPTIFPSINGTFSDKKIDSLRIYIPVREATG